MSNILFADLVDWFSLSFWWSVLQVAVVLGFLILIHEFGHFIVAKMCGVKCEKFYIGFDFYGWKLFSFQWGETEYGIGAFPLGGYVKMLGQEDNPGELRDEYERSKLAIYKNEGELPTQEKFEEQHALMHDPRSYLSKPVWQRMAIIVAGVTMNAIFAFVAGILAFCYGIQENPSEICVVPGSPAWNKGLRSGDVVVAVNNVQTVSFAQVQQNVALSGRQSGNHGVDITLNPVDSPDKVEHITVPTKSNGMNPTIGITNASSLSLCEEMPGMPGSPAALAFYSDEKKAMDIPQNTTIVTIDGKPANSYSHVAEYLRIHRNKAVTIGIQTGDEPVKEVVLQPRLMNDFGLVMKIGKITGVRPGSPAERAGVQVDDILTSVAGESITDPWKLPQKIEEKIRQHIDSGAQIPLDMEVKVSRSVDLGQGDVVQNEVVTRTLKLEKVQFTEDYSPILHQCSLAIPELGIAYEISNEVAYVVPGSPAEKSGIKPNMRITSYQFLPVEYPQDEKLAGVSRREWNKLFKEGNAVTMEQRTDWAFFMSTAQSYPAGVKVRFKTDSGKEFDVTSVQADGYYTAGRGLSVYAKYKTIQAQSFGEAIVLGVGKTNEMFALVFKMLYRLCTGDVSLKGLGGPVMLAQMAYHSANQGFGILMFFTCMISANLAIFNLLPIPVVDGGHVVFLAWEWITGYPPPQTLMVILSYIGLFLLLALLFWTLLLDTGVIPRFM